MSNPYGPPAGNDPYGQNPYGPPGGGQPGYPGTPGAPGGEPAKTDAVSIIGFVLSLLCCTSIIGAIMGFIGLGRTKNGQRKGRWAAIAAIIIGILGTLAFAGIIGIGVIGGSLLGESVGDLKTGQCINGDGVKESDETSVSSIKVVSCSDDHDGQVTSTGDLTADQADQADSAQNGICTDGLDDAITTALASGDYTIYPLTESGSPASGDAFACIVVAADGSKLTDKIG